MKTGSSLAHQIGKTNPTLIAIFATRVDDNSFAMNDDAWLNEEGKERVKKAESNPLPLSLRIEELFVSGVLGPFCFSPPRAYLPSTRVPTARPMKV